MTKLSVCDLGAKDLHMKEICQIYFMNDRTNRRLFKVVNQLTVFIVVLSDELAKFYRREFIRYKPGGKSFDSWFGRQKICLKCGICG